MVVVVECVFDRFSAINLAYGLVGFGALVCFCWITGLVFGCCWWVGSDIAIVWWFSLMCLVCFCGFAVCCLGLCLVV